MDERTTKIWAEKVWKPYVEQQGRSLLVLDEFECHKQKCFIDELKQVGTRVAIIPGCCTSVLQPCDVGINKPFKSRLKNYAENGRSKSTLSWAFRRNFRAWKETGFRLAGGSVERHSTFRCSKFI